MNKFYDGIINNVWVLGVVLSLIGIGYIIGLGFKLAS